MAILCYNIQPDVNGHSKVELVAYSKPYSIIIAVVLEPVPSGTQARGHYHYVTMTPKTCNILEQFCDLYCNFNIKLFCQYWSCTHDYMSTCFIFRWCTWHSAGNRDVKDIQAAAELTKRTTNFSNSSAAGTFTWFTRAGYMFRFHFSWWTLKAEPVQEWPGKTLPFSFLLRLVVGYWMLLIVFLNLMLDYFTVLLLPTVNSTLQFFFSPFNSQHSVLTFYPYQLVSWSVWDQFGNWDSCF